MKKKCYIIAGPNGAGKTTFANEFLPIEAECLNFINADLIASGLSPFQPRKMAVEASRLMIQHIDDCASKNEFQPRKMAVEASRLMIQHIDDCASKNESFAFETTLSDKVYIRKINEWKAQQYEVIIYYLKLPSVDFAIERVKLRVAQGGHNVLEEDIRRRFERSWDNFEKIYKPLADSWIVFDTSGNLPIILDESE